MNIAQDCEINIVTEATINATVTTLKPAFNNVTKSYDLKTYGQTRKRNDIESRATCNHRTPFERNDYDTILSYDFIV